MPESANTAQGVFPKAACTSQLRWAEQDGERAIAEAFLFLGTFCPFLNPHCGPGLARWGPEQQCIAGNPSSIAYLRQKGASPGLPLGTLQSTTA